MTSGASVTTVAAIDEDELAQDCLDSLDFNVAYFFLPTGPRCCLGLVPVEEVDSFDSCQVGGGDWCPQHPSYTGQQLGVRLSPSPSVHVSFETPPPTI